MAGKKKKSYHLSLKIGAFPSGVCWNYFHNGPTSPLPLTDWSKIIMSGGFGAFKGSFLHFHTVWILNRNYYVKERIQPQHFSSNLTFHYRQWLVSPSPPTNIPGISRVSLKQAGFVTFRYHCQFLTSEFLIPADGLFNVFCCKKTSW